MDESDENDQMDIEDPNSFKFDGEWLLSFIILPGIVYFNRNIEMYSNDY